MTDGTSTDDPIGIEIPEAHAGPFVAEVFEDPERDTDWTDVVDALVAPEAREAWEALSPTEQAAEVLKAAADYDEQAIEALADVPTDGAVDRATVETRFAEARRCRRNADTFRDGVAAAFADGYLDDEAIVAAVEAAGFDTDRIADREDELQRVAEQFDLEFRPYGGTLIQDDRRLDDPDAAETW